MNKVTVGDIEIGSGELLIIAGPCAIDSRDTVMETATALKAICARLGLPFIFKSSYDKANRTSVKSPRGPGLKEGLRILAEVRAALGVPIISDVHSIEEIGPAAEVLDALQIPAFLSRQTDLIVAAAKSGKPINIKKGQFLAPWDIRHAIDKARSTGTENIFVTERGTSFGYNTLVVDFRGLEIMRTYGYPVIFDVTHSLQQPGGQGTSSGGERQYAGALMRAAVAVGVDGLFIETHPNPLHALSDGPNMIPLAEMEALLTQAKTLHETVRQWAL